MRRLRRVGTELRAVNMTTRKRIARRVRRVLGSGIVDLYDSAEEVVENEGKVWCRSLPSPVERSI